MSVGIVPVTHAFGARPDNLASYFSEECDARLVSRFDLPMLLRVLNYAHQLLEGLCQTALNGSHNGVEQDRE